MTLRAGQVGVYFYGISLGTAESKGRACDIQSSVSMCPLALCCINSIYLHCFHSWRVRSCCSREGDVL